MFCVFWGVEGTAQTQKDTLHLQELTVYTTKIVNSSGARYHKDGCRYLRLGQFQVDEKVAVHRGLLPCSVCLPERIGEIDHLREKREVEKKKVYRKCAFRTQSGKKCSREAVENSRMCELHKGRERKR